MLFKTSGLEKIWKKWKWLEEINANRSYAGDGKSVKRVGVIGLKGYTP